jgi:hypothetical protein
LFENLPHAQRIEFAKARIKRVVDHLLYSIEIHANNSFIVYSPTLSSQIPRSYAASAFNVFQRSIYQFEIVRLCSLWDRAEFEKENIPTVVEMIDDDAIIEMLADEARLPWDGNGFGLMNPSSDPELRELEKQALIETDKQFGLQQAQRARVGLREVITEVRATLASPQLRSVMNIRDKHLAHNLTETRREQHQPIAPIESGYETELLERSIPIVERLYLWVNGTSFSIKDSQNIDQENAEALWSGCEFSVSA